MSGLTKAQREVLAFLAEQRCGEALEGHIKSRLGSYRQTITALWHRDMLSRSNVANGVLWSLTDLGRATLTAKMESGE